MLQISEEYVVSKLPIHLPIPDSIQSAETKTTVERNCRSIHTGTLCIRLSEGRLQAARAEDRRMSAKRLLRVRTTDAEVVVAFGFVICPWRSLTLFRRSLSRVAAMESLTKFTTQ